MTRNEVNQVINEIIREIVKKSGGLLKPTYFREIDLIFSAIGRLGPEPVGKLKVTAYDHKRVKRVGTLIQRSQFTKEQQDAAVAALRAVGLL